MFKKIFKFIFIFILSLIGLGLVFYISLNEKLPQGKEGKEADALADKILNNLNYDSFKNTGYLEWSFPGGHHYIWNKRKGYTTVKWDKYEVYLDLKTVKNSKVLKPKVLRSGFDEKKCIEQALKYFNNDSFWLVAPYKLYDKGVSRKLVKQQDGKKGLLITYTKGGTTPGDSYLWIVDHTGRPVSFKMWVRVIPIGGLQASWEGWKETQTGAFLASTHEILFFNLQLEKIKAYN